MKVEVELDDLETVIFASAAIRNIESTIAQAKQDPFVKTHLACTEAHDRLVGAMNSARRSAADTKIGWDDPLTKEEQKLLDEIADKAKEMGEYHNITAKDREPKKGSAMSVIDSLASKGCVRIGQAVSGVVWPGDKQATLAPADFFIVAVTPRGKDKLASQS